MKFVNRTAVVIRPKKPFLEWVAPTDPDAQGHVDIIRDRVAVYLGEATESPEAERRALQRHARMIFEAELEAWCRDPATWPQRRGPAMLREWFDVRTESVVYDLVDHELAWDNE
ncbi:MAG: hypothetical protein GXP29_05880 [Planctomycetes bacterium]|nr:hypothetical protein [Planctomycetota bacterium]